MSVCLIEQRGKQERFCSCLLLYAALFLSIPQLAVCVNSAATGVLATDGIQNLFLFPEKKSFVDQSDGNRMLPRSRLYYIVPSAANEKEKRI